MTRFYFKINEIMLHVSYKRFHKLHVFTALVLYRFFWLCWCIHDERIPRAKKQNKKTISLRKKVFDILSIQIFVLSYLFQFECGRYAMQYILRYNKKTWHVMNKDLKFIECIIFKRFNFSVNYNNLACFQTTCIDFCHSNKMYKVKMMPPQGFRDVNINVV